MAEKIETYGVRVKEVLRELPVDTRFIDECSEPLSLIDVKESIRAGAAHVEGVLCNSGIATNVSGAAREQLAEIVRAYAVMKCIARLGRTSSDIYRSTKARFDEMLERYTTRPQLLATKVERVQSNIGDTSGRCAKNTRRKFRADFKW